MSWLLLCVIQKLDHPLYGARLGMTNREWWSDFAIRVFMAAGYRGDLALLNKVAAVLIDHLHHGRGTWEMLPNASKNLEDLKCAGFKLGVVSNSDESTVPMLRTHGLASFFDFVVNTASSGLEKPDPEIFRKALESGGGVSPEEAAHVGDEIEADYLAPRKIGMTSFLLDRQRRLSSKELKNVDQKCIIHDLSELRKLIELDE